MWWWIVVLAIFVSITLGLVVPEIARRRGWERRIPRRRRRRMPESANVKVLSDTPNPAAYASRWRYIMGLWPFGIRRRFTRAHFPEDPLGDDSSEGDDYVLHP